MISQTFETIGAFSATIAILAAVIPYSWRVIQSKRLQQEELIHRELHNLELFRALSSDNPQLQLAAAAVLAERLTSNKLKNAKAEHRVIIRALLAVTKDLSTSRNNPKELSAPPGVPIVPMEISKFVADHVVKNHGLPLKQFDWQNTRLTGAWWEGVDLSEIDFWRSHLNRAGMRRAILRKTILVDAILDEFRTR